MPNGMLVACAPALRRTDGVWALVQALGQWSALNNTRLNLTMFAPVDAGFTAPFAQVSTLVIMHGLPHASPYVFYRE